MKFLTLLSTLTCALAKTVPGSWQMRDLSPLIVGGTEVYKRVEAPWMCSLVDTFYGDGHFCGCSILSEKYILTAAHCVSPNYARDYRIHAGFTTWDPQDPNCQTRNVSFIIRHPKFVTSTLENDIALIELERPLELNENVKPFILDDGIDYIQTGNEMSVLGWGATKEGGKASSELLVAQLTLRDIDECARNFTDLYTVDNCTMICAAFSGRDACQGDSGGPLMITVDDAITPYQVGIVSFGNGCALESYPGVYTRLAKYINWINDCLNDMESLACLEPNSITC